MNNLPKSRISELKECFLQWSNDYDPVEDAPQYSMFSDAMVAMDMLLAGMEQKPVGEFYEADPGNWYQRSPGDKAPKWTALYAAPVVSQPEPIAVPECFQRLLKHAHGLSMGVDWNKGTSAGFHREKLLEAVKDCRAAMLNPGTLTNEDTKQVQSRIDESVELLKQAAPQMLAMKGPDGALVGPRKSNPPVIPDGWKLVPETATKEMIISATRDNLTGEVSELYDLMLAAAPQPPAPEA